MKYDFNKKPNIKSSILPIAAIIFLSFSCASVRHSSVPDNSIMTAEKYDACVNPKESYFIKRLRVRVLRHENCAGIDDLLTVVWAGELTEDSIRGASILAVAYVTHLTRIDSSENQYFVNYLNSDSFPYRTGIAHIAFFKIGYKNKGKKK